MALVTLQTIFQDAFPAYEQRHALPAHVRRAAHAIMQCRTAAPGGLGQLPLALGFARRRQPLRGRRLRLGRRRPKLRRDRGGDPNEVGSLLTVFGTTGVRLDTIQQRPSLVGAEIDCLEACEQFAALKHSALPRRRDAIFGVRRRSVV
jgi:hypothetical protein